MLHYYMRTLRHHRQAIYNITEWIGQSTDPEFIAQQEQRIQWHEAEIERIRQYNKERDQRHRKGPDWRVMLERAQAKIDRKEQTLDFYRAEMQHGRNPHYYQSMTGIAEFDLKVLRAEKAQIQKKAKEHGYVAE